jgi:carbonic anhydrase
MHKAKAVVLLCIDFRFQKTTQDWLFKNGYHDKTDQIVVAGASRDLTNPIDDAHKKALLRQLQLSIKLHDPDEIIIIDHQDCGGYAQDNTIPPGLPFEEDKKLHSEFAQKAKEILQKEFPSKTLKTFYATLHGTIEAI